MTWVKRRKCWRMSCDVGEVTESLENELCSCGLQAFCHFTYVTAHSPTLPSLYLRHNSFSNHSVASPTSQLILQHFRHFTYVTTHSPTLPLLHLRHSSFSNPSFASPASQALHLRHLASRPWVPQFYFAPIQSLVKLQPWFLSLPWKTCLRQNYSLGSCACSEGPALGQNSLMMII